VYPYSARTVDDIPNGKGKRKVLRTQDRYAVRSDKEVTKNNDMIIISWNKFSPLWSSPNDSEKVTSNTFQSI
jgi:hypothetical protein